MKRNIRNFLGLVALSLLVACASDEPGRDINDPTNSLVFGYIDMDDAPTSISSAWLEQVAPRSDKPYWGMGVQDGLFYNVHLPPGSYQLSKLSGSGFFAGQHSYTFPRQGNDTSLRIKKPGIYFLGSYKYKKVSTGFFSQAKFDITRTKKPTEAELLQRILDKNSEVRDSAWGPKIRKRLTELKR